MRMITITKKIQGNVFAVGISAIFTTADHMRKQITQKWGHLFFARKDISMIKKNELSLISSLMTL